MAINVRWGVFILVMFSLVASIAFVQAQIPNPGHSSEQIDNLDDDGGPFEFCTSFNSNPAEEGDQRLGCGCTAGLLLSPLLGPPEVGYIAKFITSNTYENSIIFQDTSGPFNNVRIGDGPHNIHALTVFGGARFGSVITEGLVQSDAINMFNEDAFVRGGGKMRSDFIFAFGEPIEELDCSPDGGTYGGVCASNDLIIGGTLFVEGVGDLAECEICFPPLRVAASGPEEGLVAFDVSSVRYKENIKSLEEDFGKILNTEAKTFVFKETKDESFGYIAEEFVELGLENLVIFDNENRPEAISYDKINVYLVEVIKEQEKVLDQLEELVCEDYPDSEVCNEN